MTTKTLTQADIRELLVEARTQAHAAANRKLGELGSDWGACGFAWTTLYEYNDKKLDGRSKLAKLLMAEGVRKAAGGGFQIWNPSGLHAQNVDVLDAGARAAAQVFKDAGFKAYAGSRLD